MISGLETLSLWEDTCFCVYMLLTSLFDWEVLIAAELPMVAEALYISRMEQ